MFTGFALIDCNNFFVSCERTIDPRLIGKPVVVLSRNNGIIVARSNEAKALGIPMGGVHFEWREFMERHKVIALSSNFQLYDDLSNQVMSIIQDFHGDVEVYSIDEAFCLFENEKKDPLPYCLELAQKIFKKTKIPVSIGIAPTKTLAKVAADKAKKMEGERIYGILTQQEIDRLLSNLPVIDVWGIGRRVALSLRKKGVYTASELVLKDNVWIKNSFSVNLLRTVLELRGEVTFSFGEGGAPQKSIMTSRSFSEPITSFGILEGKISSFAARCARKLREEGSLASSLEVFIMTSPHSDNFYGDQTTVLLAEPTSYPPKLIEAAKNGLQEIYKAKLSYKRAGVILMGLIPQEPFQRDLFLKSDPKIEKKRGKLIEVSDQINGRFGDNTLRFLAELPKKDQS